MKLLRFLLSCFLLITVTIGASGQIEEELLESRKGKFYVIPEFSFWLGTYSNIEVAPQLAYHLTDRLSLGAGPHYIYYKNIDFYSADVFTTHMWGFKAFSRLSIIKDAASFLPVYIFDELFAHVEYEKMRVESEYFNNNPTLNHIWIDHFFVGFGINQKAVKYSSYSFTLLWNINNSLSNLYSNPSYRIGMNLYF